MTCSNNNNAFGKTICSICYEDLKPLIEDLQSISICGHVFHELCLQQWLEYCAKAKKSTCPVCKQKCTHENVGRLYFQSIGDPNECIQSQKRVLGNEEDAVLLNLELNKLKGKLSAQCAVFERQQQDLKELNTELCACKEQLKREVTLKSEALRQNASIQQSLRSKSEESVKMSLECSRLQERNMALAKELAALKLVSDLNLDEDEVLKLASFGHGTNSKDTVDVLKKSLVLRNKSYKELMAQCNLLGRGETRSLKKLEKAKEKLKNLKTRVKELELALEEKDNKALRDLKASSKASSKIVDPNGVKWESDTSFIQKCSLDDHQKEEILEPMIRSGSCGGLTNQRFPVVKTSHSDLRKESGLRSHEKGSDVIFVDLESEGDFKDDGSSLPSPSVNRESTFGVSNLSISKKSVDNRHVVATEKDVMLNSSPNSALDASAVDEVTEIPSLLHTRKENSSSLSIFNPGDQCFARGLLGPDGSTRYLGKWCKKTQKQGSSTGDGDLIAAGADGRGGRIKVLRTQNHMDVKSTSVSKKCKNGVEQTQQAQGCMRIDHFFGKAGRS